MNRRVLFVDDELQVLRALARSLGDRFEVLTAGSGAEALDLLAREAPVAVIISDMRMPAMDGATLLGHVRRLHPSVTRMLLTGYADLSVTVQAVNEGNIFRFLVKPCPEETLLGALEDGIGQHSLLVAEKELLERTLSGAVAALAEVLSLVDPALFSRATRIEGLVKTALDHLGFEPRWAFEMAARLSQLGCVALPRDIVQRVNAAATVTERERALYDSHPETASRILRTIPRLEVVADVVRYQFVREVPKLERREVSQGVDLLRAAVLLDSLMQKGLTREQAVEAAKRRGATEHAILEAFLTDDQGSATSDEDCQRVTVAQLKTGVILVNDVLSSSGAIVVPAGREVTSLVLDRLRKFSEGGGIVEPLLVSRKR